MKAVVIQKFGGPEVLQVAERPVPEPTPNEVLIRVRAAGVNGHDLGQRRGDYPPPPDASPDIPGLEAAGVIEQCGTAVTKWKVGDQVCALLNGGGYAEYAIADERCCLPIPARLDFAQAASLPEAIFTVWHNVFQRAALKEGEHLLVHGGSSGVGIAAIQMAKALGSKVFVTARSPDKCEACLGLGADQAVNYSEDDFVKTLKPLGVDVVLDMVGAPYLQGNLSVLRPEGRLVFINYLGGNELKTRISTIMIKRLSILGSTLRNRDIEFKAQLTEEVLKKVWPLIERNNFSPVIYKTLPLTQADQAHRILENSEHIGKVMLVPD